MRTYGIIFSAQISRTVEALQLWAEKMMADGRIDRAAYTREISAAGEK